MNKITLRISGFEVIHTYSHIVRFSDQLVSNLKKCAGKPTISFRLSFYTWLPFLFVVCFFSTTSHGQVFSVKNKLFHNYTLRDGLSQSTVRSVLQSSDGYIWIGTTYGLNRFDGHSFKNYSVDRFSEYSLSNPWINWIEEDYNGDLWIGTNGGGLNRFDPILERFYPITDSTGTFLHDDKIISLHIDSDSVLWMGTFKGLARYSIPKQTFLPTLYPPELEMIGSTLVHEFFHDRYNRLWIATDQGLAHWNRNSQSLEPVHILHSDGTLFKERLFVRTLTEDVSGDLWMGTRFKGVFRLIHQTNNNSWKAVPLPQQNQLLSKHITSIVADGNNHLWIGTKIGLYGIDLTNGEIARYNKDQRSAYGFKDQMVLRLYIDKSENLWVSSQTSGVYLTSLKPDRFSLISKDILFKNPALHRELWSVYKQGDTLWVGTNNGLSAINHEPLSLDSQPSLINEFLTGHEILAIRGDSKGQLWLASYGKGLLRLNTSSPTPKIDTFSKESFPDLPANSVIALELVHDSLLFVGTGKGLAQIHLSTFEIDLIPYSDEKEFPKSTTVYALTSDGKDRLWVGTLDGVFEWNISSKTSTRIDLSLKGEQFRVVNEIMSLNYTSWDNRLWIGTNNGLMGLIPSEKVSFYADTRHSLPSNMILGINCDPINEEIWISTTKGLAQISQMRKSPIIQPYSQEYPFYSNEFSVGAYYSTSNGTLYFGGIDGIHWFNPTLWTFQYDRPKVNLTRAVIPSPDSIKIISLRDTKTITLNPDENSVDISFISNEIGNLSALKYQYNIEGISESWTVVEGEPTIKLSGLRNGEYTFNVAAIYNTGSTLFQTESLKIIVLPYFWETGVFQSVLTLMSMIFIGFLVNRRFQRLEEDKKELELKVDERTKELLETNEQLRHSEELFRSITDNVADLVVMATPEGEIVYCSPSVSTLLGFDESEVVSKNVAPWIHPDDYSLIQYYTRSIFEHGRAYFDAYRLKHKTDGYRSFISSASSIVGKDGKVQFIVTVSRDVTEQMKVQELMVAAKEAAEQANRSKSNFLAGISHELRTPLNAILGYARLLYEDDTLGTKHQNYAEIMYKSGDHLLNMINDILDLSKIEAGKMEVETVSFDLKSLLKDIKSVFDLKAREKNLTLSLSFDGELTSNVIGDKNKLRQILLNLVSNSIKYTPQGEVSIICSTTVREDRYLSLSLSVVDTGLGIPEEQAKSIFEPFKQVEGRFNSGTGLGLALTKKFVELLSGSIHLESTLNTGTTVEVRLAFPLEQSQTGTKPQVEEQLPILVASDRPIQVIIVDDIETNSRFLNDLLTPIGFHCSVASDGFQALEHIYQNIPDLVLTDLIMPNMTGEELLRKVRLDSSLAHLPMIAVTASGFSDTKETMLSLGFDACLFKPVNMGELFQTIKEVLHLEYVFKSDSPTGLIHSKERTESGKTMSSSPSPVQKIIKSIISLPESEQRQWLDAFELLDLSILTQLSTNTNISEEAQILLTDSIQQTNYKFLLTLSETLMDSLNNEIG